MNYYNDNDPGSVAWLRELVKQKLIPAGDVDERSIADVTKADLEGYTQCHFFAGIGGWSEALRLAGWPADHPVWTGSCPCQPFSSAGKRQGTKDKRHLWPEFYRLIRECKPSVVFGEQVASPLGRKWLAGVRADLEALGYAVGAADLCAAGVGAPHIRQRLYWVADPNGRRVDIGQKAERGAKSSGVGADGFWDDAVWIPCADGKARRIKPGLEPLVDGLPGRVALLRGAGNAIVPQVAAEFVKAYMEVRND